jgi:hypothetical protein
MEPMNGPESAPASTEFPCGAGSVPTESVTEQLLSLARAATILGRRAGGTALLSELAFGAWGLLVLSIGSVAVGILLWVAYVLENIAPILLAVVVGSLFLAWGGVAVLMGPLATFTMAARQEAVQLKDVVVFARRRNSSLRWLLFWPLLVIGYASESFAFLTRARNTKFWDWDFGRLWISQFGTASFAVVALLSALIAGFFGVAFLIGEMMRSEGTTTDALGRALSLARGRRVLALVAVLTPLIPLGAATSASFVPAGLPMSGVVNACEIALAVFASVYLFGLSLVAAHVVASEKSGAPFWHEN